MTVADPYPTNLAELDEEPIHVNPEAVTNRLIAAINRLAQAIEANGLTPRQTVQNGPGAALSQLPPVQTIVAAPAGVCPIHNTPWKVVPAGVSKKTGKPYDAFMACSTSGCDQRPQR